MILVVLLRELLSNLSTPLIALDEAVRKEKAQVRRGISPLAVKRQDGEKRRSLVQPNRKLRPFEVDDLAQRYLAGARLAELGRRFGIHEQTVRANLQRRGVELRGKQVLSSAQIREVVRRYEAGESSVELGRAIDVADSTIRNVLRRAGAVVRPAGYHGR